MSILPRADRSRSPEPRRACGLILLSLALVVVIETPGRVEGRPHAQEGPAQRGAAQLDSPLEEIRQLLKDGRFSDAETRARGLLEESVGTYGAGALETALVLDVLVEALWRGGKSGEPETRDLAQRAVVLKEEGLGGEDLSVATSLVNLGIVCSDGGDYAGAETAYRRALALRERALGAGHPDVARTLNNLGVVFFHRGEYATAREQHERALAIREKALVPRHADVATSLSNLALVSGVTGDYAQARPLLERALAIREEALGPEHPYVSTTLSDLASVLFALGDYDEARVFYERSLAVAEKAWNPDHPALARVLNGLAALSMATGEHERARALYERVLAIREKSLGPQHPVVASSLEVIARVTARAGNYVDARAKYERAIAIREAVEGPEHPNVARTWRSLAVLLVSTGSPVEARSMLDRAIGIQERVLGAHHPELAASLVERARALVRVGDRMNAFRDALRAEEIAREHLRLTARTLTEREALRYAAVRTSGLNLALSLAAGPEPQGTGAPGGQGPAVGPLPALARQALDALIRSRALVLDEMAERHRTVVGRADPEVARLEGELASARQRLANLAVRGADEKDLARWRARLERARKDKEELERALADQSLPFRQEQARRRLGLEAIAAALSPGEALLSFTRYEQYGMNAGSALPRAAADPVPAYLAFVLQSGDGEPRSVPLGPAREIDTLVSELRDRMTEEARAPGRSVRRALGAYRRVGEALREKIWDPVAPHLKGVRRVFVVPDGALNLVNLSALPAGGSGYLLEHEPLIHYLSTERDLVPLEAQGQGEGLLALAAPAFDEIGLFAAMAPRPERAGSPAGRQPTASATVASLQVFRGARSACGDFKSMRFEPLPEAGRELDEIAKLWDERARGGSTGSSRAAGSAPDVARLVGPDASEGAFKHEAPGHRVLHLATHGFFLGGRCGSLLDARKGDPLGEPVPGFAAENPLLLSGLAMAGANHREAAGPDEEDGILTAEEIAALDLSGTQWAVLSACDTGVGEVKAGEGVFGLRRAFQVAGVRTLILSLWPVEDESARQWMRALYRSRFAEGKETAEAVRAASLEVLRQRKAKRLSTHPFYWAGFVAAGDWR